MAKTKIEWVTNTDGTKGKTWNPITGCSKISPGCANCYAERLSHRFGAQWGLPEENPFQVTLHPARLEQPLRWNKPSTIFVCSMSDLFHNEVPFSFLEKVFNVIQECEQHTFLILTKRPQRMKEFFKWYDGPYFYNNKETTNYFSNVWLGVTAENQEQADLRIPVLLETPAAKRFVSVEPMLSAVDLSSFSVDGGIYYPLDGAVGVDGRGHCPGPKLDWVICGGESGPGARPVHPEWIRKLKIQCVAAEVPFLFKQWGEFAPSMPKNGTKPTTTSLNCIGVNGHNAVTMEDGLVMARVGKSAAGRLLDGQLWDQYPSYGGVK